MRVMLTRPQLNLLSYRFPDIGLGYLATGLRNAGFTPIIHVPDTKGWQLSSSIETIRQSDSDIVGIKVMTADLLACRQLYDALLSTLPRLPIVLGGPHVSGAKETIFSQFPGLKYAFAGEADRSFPQFVETFLKTDFKPSDDDMKSIPGLMWQSNGEVRCNSVDVIDDLDALGCLPGTS